MGVGIWLVSIPLATSHPAPVRTTEKPSALGPLAASRDRLDETVRATVERSRVLGQHSRPPELVVGERIALRADAEVQAPTRGVPTPLDANSISIARVGLKQPVGWYTDCLGRAPVSRWGSWRWSCAGANNTYILGHNPGVFTPILGLRPGDIVQYDDAGGIMHTYRVTMTTIVSNTQLWPLDATAVPSLTLQTCWTPDGSRDFIVRAVQF